MPGKGSRSRVAWGETQNVEKRRNRLYTVQPVTLMGCRSAIAFRMSGSPRRGNLYCARATADQRNARLTPARIIFSGSRTFASNNKTTADEVYAFYITYIKMDG